MAIKRKFDHLDSQFENFLDNVLLEFVETDFTPEKRKVRRAKTDKDDLVFAKTYFPQIFFLEWNDAHHWIAALQTGKYTLSGHPESGKSALATLTQPSMPPAPTETGCGDFITSLIISYSI